MEKQYRTIQTIQSDDPRIQAAQLLMQMNLSTDKEIELELRLFKILKGDADK